MGIDAMSGEQIPQDIKRESKTLARQGWKPVPGTLPIAEQLQQAYSLSLEMTEDSLNMRYMMASSSATAEDINKAKAIAQEYARQDMASQIKSQVDAITNIVTHNRQDEDGKVESTLSKLAETKLSVMQNIRKVKPVMELYRNTKDGDVEVFIKIAYDVNELLLTEDRYKSLQTEE